MGWDESGDFKLQDAVDTCTNLSGEIEDCPLFTIQSEAVQKECSFDAPEALLKELVGTLTSIPGDVPVAWGPGPATDANPTTPTSIVIPTLTYSAGSTASVNGSYVPGNAFVGVTSSTATSVTVKAAVGGITSAPAADATTTTTATSTMTTTNADGSVMVNEVIYEEVITYVTDSTTTTIYVEPTAAAVRRRGPHKHRHVHGSGN